MGDARDHDREIIRRLRALADEPLPAATRERHLTRLREASAAPPRLPAPGRRRVRVRRRLVPVLAAMVALLVVSGGGAVAAAQDATPDDPLYGIKRASEQVWVAMPRDAERAAQVQLRLAMRRHGEAMRAPAHAERMLAAAAANVEQAADELPEEAFETFQRLLGDGEQSLPASASPRAREALYRNCLRLAARHEAFVAASCPEPDDLGEHPGRGMGPDGHRGGGPREWGDGEKPGWGPDGRPDDHVGPPPWAPGADRAEADDTEE